MWQQVHVYYTGRVQGIGFRYTARDIASELGVFGWVKNLPDGRVELTAEAEEAVLKEFLEKINQYFSRDIQDIETKWAHANDKFKDFVIRF
jgi:acylphosphatase